MEMTHSSSMVAAPPQIRLWRLRFEAGVLASMAAGYLLLSSPGTAFVITPGFPCHCYNYRRHWHGRSHIGVGPGAFSSSLLVLSEDSTSESVNVDDFLLSKTTGNVQRNSCDREGTVTDESQISPWLDCLLYNCDLQVAEFPDTTGRGLRTLRDRRPGDILIAIPKNQAVTQHSIQDKFPQIFQPLLASANNTLNEEQILALGLLLLRNQNDPYVQSLPLELFSVLNHPHMPDGLFRCFPASYRRLISACRKHVQGLHASLLEAMQKAQLPLKTVELAQAPADFEWAFGMVRSRTVGMPAQDWDRPPLEAAKENNSAQDTAMIRVLFPGFDLLNHQFQANVTQDVHDGNFVVVSHDTYEAGQQVFISYASHDCRRDNLNMLLTYGFCPMGGGGNPEQVLFFDVQNLLVACAHARPEYFTAHVVVQLQSIFAKLGQSKDLFRYDGRLQQPRPCLARGLAMMAELEKQFLFEDGSDPDFAEDVLTALLEMRQQEIDQGVQNLAGLKGTIESNHSRWMGMYTSIQNLLALEQDYLP